MQQRRTFLGAAFSLIAAGLLPQFAIAQTTEQQRNSKRKPKRLKKGDTIGLIAPGYAITEDVLEQTKKELTSLGLIPLHTDRILWRHGYFSNTDTERAADIMEFFANTSVAGILCVRGGYGCTRIMHLLDFDLIKANPKVLIGFSDVTALLNGIYQETGLCSFHGPVGSTLNDAFSKDRLAALVMRPKSNRILKNTDSLTKKQLEQVEYERYVITDGTAKGILVGGNLSLLVALMGTPYEVNFTDAIVCIEDIEEAPYRIDRMLTQLLSGKTFRKAAAIVFGVCSGCNSSTNSNSFTLKEVLLDRIKPLGIPAIYGMSFGHIDQNLTFPVGIKAQLNTQKMHLKLLEKPVT